MEWLRITLFVSAICSVSNSIIESPQKEVNGFLGVAFRYKLISTEKGYHELLTEDQKPLPKDTWVRLHYGHNEIYGLPLYEKGKYTYYIASEVNGHKSTKKIPVIIRDWRDDFLHEVKLCTNLTNDLFLNHLDRRYILIDNIAKYLLNTDVQNVKVRRYKDGCFWFSFLHIENEKRCDYEKIDQIQKRMFNGGEISSNFIKKLSSIELLSANLNFTGGCVRPTKKKEKENIGWVKTVAPIMILLGIILIPVSISCYVLRGVRRRQNKMRQQEEKRLKEESIRVQEQMNEYKRACGLDGSFETEADTQHATTPKWNQVVPRNGKRVFLTNLLERYTPQGIQNKFELLSRSKKTLNPISRMLDIRTNTNGLTNNRRLRNSLNNQGRAHALTSYLNNTNMYGDNLPEHLASSAVNLRRSSTMYSPVLPLLDSKRKSVSFFDISGPNRFSAFESDKNSAYRRFSDETRRKLSSQSCTAVDKLKSYGEDNNFHSTPFQAGSTNFGHLNSRSCPRITPSKKTVSVGTSTESTGIRRSRSQSVINSMKNLAATGKDIAAILRERRQARKRQMAGNFRYDVPIGTQTNKQKSQIRFYIGDETDDINMYYDDSTITHGVPNAIYDKNFVPHSKKDNMTSYTQNALRKPTRKYKELPWQQQARLEGHVSSPSVSSTINDDHLYLNQLKLVDYHVDKATSPSELIYSQHPSESYTSGYYEDDLIRPIPNRIQYPVDMKLEQMYHPTHKPFTTRRKNGNAAERRKSFRKRRNSTNRAVLKENDPSWNDLDFAIRDGFGQYGGYQIEKENLSQNPRYPAINQPHLFNHPQHYGHSPTFQMDERSLGSVSSDVTYMDLGSEYELSFEQDFADYHKRRKSYSSLDFPLQQFSRGTYEERNETPYIHNNFFPDHTDTYTTYSKGNSYFTQPSSVFVKSRNGIDQFV